MELDGYSEKYGLAFEHDGIQHRVRVEYFQPNEGDFEAQAKRDRLKDEKCDNLGITLVRVPDRGVLPLRKIRQYVRDAIIDLGYDVPEVLPDDSVFYANVRAKRSVDKYIEKVRKIVTDRNGTLQSDSIPTREWPILVCCAQDHKFETKYDNLVRGRWCPECSPTKPKSDDHIRAAAEERKYTLISSTIREDKGGRRRRYVTVKCPEEKHGPTELLWDNFKKGGGCKLCGSARSGASHACSGKSIDGRLSSMGVQIIGKYSSLNKVAIFICDDFQHRFTSTVKKLEMTTGTKCPVCVAEGYPGLTLESNYTEETDQVKTKLTWNCEECGHDTTTTPRGMRIRKYKCGYKQCPSRTM